MHRWLDCLSRGKWKKETSATFTSAPITATPPNEGQQNQSSPLGITNATQTSCLIRERSLWVCCPLTSICYKINFSTSCGLRLFGSHRTRPTQLVSRAWETGRRLFLLLSRQCGSFSLPLCSAKFTSLMHSNTLE